MRVGSLFAGIGGFDLGFDRAGMEPCWQVEINTDCGAVLSRHWPGVERFEDIKDLHAVSYREAARGIPQAADRGNGATLMVPTVLQRAVKGESFTTKHSRTAIALEPDGTVRDDRGCPDRLIAGSGREVRDMRRPADKDARGPRPCNRQGARAALSSLQPAAGGIRGSDLLSQGYRLSPVEVICAGFPCQDLSVAGKRAGLDGDRSGLFFEVIRIIKEMREATGGRSPEYVVLENVPGLLSSNSGRDFAVVLGELAGVGALDIGWRICDAQYWGVAQRRRRVFIVADFRDRRAAAVLFEPESCNGDSPPSRETGQSAAYTLAASVRGTGDGHGNAWNSNYIAATLRSRQHADGVNPPGRGGEDDQNLVVAHALCSRTAKGGDPTTDTYIAHTLRAEGCEPSEDGTGRGTPLVVDTTQITSGANYSNPKPGDACHPLASGAHAPLMVQPSVRRLTPVECERLQGFPDGWTEYGVLNQINAIAPLSDSARYRMLGNAVCVPVAEWIGRRIVSAAS